MTSETVGDGSPAQENLGAVGRGWFEQPGGVREPALFMLSGPSLGVSGQAGATPPQWYDLGDVTGLDAVGDPVEGLQTVEVAMGGSGRGLRAGWTEEFCASVVEALRSTLAPSDAEHTSSTPAPAPAPASPVEAPPVDPVPAVASPVQETSADAVPADTAPVATGESGAALVLEDVTYLGGYPGQDRKHKRCTATLTRDALELSGSKGVMFRVPWDGVRSIEAQNADEARFRMNTKIHRDATALVLECDQTVTVLLEARDCPTIPLRGAIAQLVDDLSVVVV